MRIHFKTKRLIKKGYSIAAVLFIFLVLTDLLLPFTLPWFAIIGCFILAVIMGIITLILFVGSSKKDLLTLFASMLLLVYGGRNLFYAILNSF